MIHTARHPSISHCLDCNRALDRRNTSGRCKSCYMAENNRSREKRALASARMRAQVLNGVNAAALQAKYLRQSRVVAETAEIRDRDARLLALRDAGMSWKSIGQLLGGMSKQAVAKRWQTLMVRQGVIAPEPVIDRIEVADNDTAEVVRFASDELARKCIELFERTAKRERITPYEAMKRAHGWAA